MIKGIETKTFKLIGSQLVVMTESKPYVFLNLKLP
jgi:hypothetical protein